MTVLVASIITAPPASLCRPYRPYNRASRIGFISHRKKELIRHIITTLSFIKFIICTSVRFINDLETLITTSVVIVVNLMTALLIMLF